jgi:FKBP-type peptidyl-prolyl cis-trans isomerase SlyD
MSQPETIGPDRIVTLHYTLTTDGDQVIETSEGDEPLTYLHGHGHVIPGLEKALFGKKAGDTGTFTVTPEDGYGPHDPERVVREPRARIGFEVQQGMILEAQLEDGSQHPFQVVEVTDTEVSLDGNHPLAGKTLQFAVRVLEVRAATPHEIAHGHAHGPGCDHGH